MFFHRITNLSYCTAIFQVFIIYVDIIKGKRERSYETLKNLMRVSVQEEEEETSSGINSRI